jgi:hypothetical protein
MAKPRGRAARRAQVDRAKDRSRRTWREMDAQDGTPTGRDKDPRWVGMRATTRTFESQEDRSWRGAHRRAAVAHDTAEQIREAQ